MKIRRREFLAGLGGFGAGLGLGAISHALPLGYPQLKPAWSPGRERKVASTCLLCPSHCGIRGRIVDGRLVRIEGNPLHPVSRGGLCPKGVAGLQILHHPARLTGPLERTGPAGTDAFRRISWEEALDRLAGALSGIRARGRERGVAFLTGHAPGIMGELIRRFAGLYGSPNVLREDYDDGSAEVLRLCQGIDAPPAFDLESADFVLSFGAALSESWWCLPQAARSRDPESGDRPRFVQIDVRHSRTAARADDWVPIRLGAYGALALGFAYVMLKEGLYDADRVREQVAGMEDEAGGGAGPPGFRSLVLRHGRTEEVSRRTGVPSETIVRIAKRFGSARRALAIWDHNVSWRTGGLSDALAIHALNILAGAPGRPGGILVQPAFPFRPIEAPGGAPGGPPAALGPADWAASAQGREEPPLDAIFLYRSNPVASSPDGDGASRALQRIPLVVSFSPFLDESARHAHLVLPDHTYLERWQDAPAPASVPIPVWGLVQPLSAPLNDTRATGDVLLDLARRLGGALGPGLPWASVEAIVRERGAALAEARRGSFLDVPLRRRELREMEGRGWWIQHGLSAEEFWERVREAGGWFDPYYDYHDRSAVSQFEDGRVRVFPVEARLKIAGSAAGSPESYLPSPEPAPEDGPAGGYPLRLVPFRVMTLASGGTALTPWLLERAGVLTGDAWEVWAEINPATGRELGLAPGGMVRIESRDGAFSARLRFYAGAQPGVVNVPYGLHTEVEGWGRLRAANPLRAAGARRDPSTGLPDWHSARVRVVPA